MQRTDIETIAKETGHDKETVLNVLLEIAGNSVPRPVQDHIFKTARRMGYDFKKLKISKRMTVIREALGTLISQIEKHPRWGRKHILAYLKEDISLVERVQKRLFKDDPER